MLILESKVNSAIFNDKYFAKNINVNHVEQINGKIRPINKIFVICNGFKVSYAHQRHLLDQKYN